ncbi:ATP-binding protein [Streptomyces sp. NPDC004286]|uniref:ATP-binding protein n=1 Tax=Streptomyces sp. NPDC004286 TaxID=3364696 RepID=UPI0036962960
MRAVTGNPAYLGVLQRDEYAAADTRHVIRTVLARWGLEHFTDDSTLVATELVANAARHAHGPVIRVTLTLMRDTGVRVAVTDESTQLPVMRSADELAESGRGLHLIEAASTRWGVLPFAWGKQVWAEVSR